MKILKPLLALAGFAAVIWLFVAIGGDRLPKTNRIRVEIAGCKYKADGNLAVQKDQNVSLTVVSDRAGEFHIHGYDLLKGLSPNRPETFNFRAVQPGVFDMEHHDCQPNHIMLVVLNEDGSEPNIEQHDEEEHDESENDEASGDSHSEGEHNRSETRIEIHVD